MEPAQHQPRTSQERGPHSGDLNEEFGLGAGRRLSEGLEAEIGPEAASKVLREIGARIQARVSETFLRSEDLAAIGKTSLTPEQTASFVSQINLSSLRNQIEQESEARLSIQDIQQVLSGTNAAGRVPFELVCQTLGVDPQQLIMEAKASVQ